MTLFLSPLFIALSQSPVYRLLAPILHPGHAQFEDWFQLILAGAGLAICAGFAVYPVLKNRRLVLQARQIEENNRRIRRRNRPRPVAE